MHVAATGPAGDTPKTQSRRRVGMPAATHGRRGAEGRGQASRGEAREIKKKGRLVEKGGETRLTTG